MRDKQSPEKYTQWETSRAQKHTHNKRQAEPRNTRTMRDKQCPEKYTQWVTSRVQKHIHNERQAEPRNIHIMRDKQSPEKYKRWQTSRVQKHKQNLIDYPLKRFGILRKDRCSMRKVLEKLKDTGTQDWHVIRNSVTREIWGSLRSGIGVGDDGWGEWGSFAEWSWGIAGDMDLSHVVLMICCSIECSIC